MKKYLFIIGFLLSGALFSQTNSGITYQAVIYNPGGEELPGADNMYAPLTEHPVCLRFNFIDSSNGLEYQEVIQVTTDVFGMVNVIIGNEVQTGGYAQGFDGILWDGTTKFLMVEVDSKTPCDEYTQISNQPFTYVPFAYYSANPGNPGPAGPAGPAGAAGAAGADGADGVDGATGPAGPTGPTGPAGSTGPIGPQGETGPTGPQGPEGDSGGEGTTGLNSLLATSDEPAGANCENGGTKIEVGLDANSNGTLDTDEVDASQTQYICDGVDGEDGEDGSGDGSGFLTCNESELLAKFTIHDSGNNEVYIETSDTGNYYYDPSQDENYDQYIIGGVGQASEKTIEIDDVNSNKIVINGYNGHGKISNFGIDIKLYDSGNNLINVNYKKTSMYWRGASVAGSSAEANGGSFNSFPEDDATFVSEILRPTPVISYFNSNNYTGLLGSTYGENNSIPNGNYFYEFEINSDTTINKITITYDAGVVASSDLYTGIYKFNCSSTTSTGGSSSDGSGDGSGCDYKTVSVVEAPEDALYISGNNTGLSNAALWGTQLAIDGYQAWNTDVGSNIQYENYPNGNYEGQPLIKEYTGINSSELVFQFMNSVGDWGPNTLVGIRAYDSNNNLVPFYYEHEFFGYDYYQGISSYTQELNEGKLFGNSEGNFQWAPYRFHSGIKDKAHTRLKIVSGVEIERIEVEFNKFDQSISNTGDGAAIFHGQLFIWKFDCADGSDTSSGSSGTTQVNSASCDVKLPQRVLGWTTDDVSLNLNYSISYEPTYNDNTPTDWAAEAGNYGAGFAVGLQNAGPSYTAWPSTTAESVIFTKTGLNTKEVKIEYTIIDGAINYSVRCYNNQGELINVYAEQRHTSNVYLIGGFVDTRRYSDYISSTEISSQKVSTDRIHSNNFTQGKVYSDLNIFSNQLIDKIEIQIDVADNGITVDGSGRVDFKVWEFSCVDN